MGIRSVQNLELQDSDVNQRTAQSIGFSLLNLLDHIKTAYHLSENSIGTIKPRSTALLIALVILKTFLVRVLTLLYRPLTPGDIELRGRAFELRVLVIPIACRTKSDPLPSISSKEDRNVWLPV